jgi:hypothetical protein
MTEFLPENSIFEFLEAFFLEISEKTSFVFELLVLQEVKEVLHPHSSLLKVQGVLLKNSKTVCQLN